MNDPTGRAVREAFERLTDVPVPGDLAVQALRRPRSRRPQAALVAAGLVLVVAAPTVFLWLRGTGAEPALPPEQPPPPWHADRVVVAYNGIDPDGGATDPGPANDTALLLNFATGTYDSVPYNMVFPSPDLQRVVVERGDNSLAHPAQTGVAEMPIGEVAWLPHNPRRIGWPPAWSPDSHLVAFPEVPSKGVFGEPWRIEIVDAQTLDSHSIEIPEFGQHGNGPFFAFASDGTQLMVLAGDHPGSEAALPSYHSIQYYGLDGTPGQLVRFPAEIIGINPQFSPDGSLLLLHDWTTSTTTIVDTSSGAIAWSGSTPGLSPWGWYDATHYVAGTGFDQGGGEEWAIVQATTGEATGVTGRLRPPPGRPTFSTGPTIIGSAEGLAPAGNQYRF